MHAQIITELEPGWHEAVLDVGAAPDLEPVACPVRIVDPNARIGVVCDIDDTVLITSVPRPLLATWNTFVLREHARRPVPGMGAFLHALAGDDGFVVYLSTGAWNFAPHLERFMAEHDLPPGPLFLTDWGPTSSGWFRSGAAHKRATLRQLRAEHPHTKWFLVGDDGQRDPEIYAEFAAAHPTAVAAVAIRHLTPTQQLLAQGVVPSHPEAPSGVDLGSVPWITGADGIELTQAYATIVTEDDREHSK